MKSSIINKLYPVALILILNELLISLSYSFPTDPRTYEKSYNKVNALIYINSICTLDAADRVDQLTDCGEEAFEAISKWFEISCDNTGFDVYYSRIFKNLNYSTIKSTNISSNNLIARQINLDPFAPKIVTDAVDEESKESFFNKDVYPFQTRYKIRKLYELVESIIRKEIIPKAVLNYFDINISDQQLLANKCSFGKILNAQYKDFSYLSIEFLEIIEPKIDRFEYWLYSVYFKLDENRLTIIIIGLVNLIILCLLILLSMVCRKKNVAK